MEKNLDYKMIKTFESYNGSKDRIKILFEKIEEFINSLDIFFYLDKKEQEYYYESSFGYTNHDKKGFEKSIGIAVYLKSLDLKISFEEEYEYIVDYILHELEPLNGHVSDISRGYYTPSAEKSYNISYWFISDSELEELNFSIEELEIFTNKNKFNL